MVNSFPHRLDNLCRLRKQEKEEKDGVIGSCYEKITSMPEIFKMFLKKIKTKRASIHLCINFLYMQVITIIQKSRLVACPINTSISQIKVERPCYEWQNTG